MAIATLLDTGPLYAALSKQDRHHSWAKGALADCPAPLITCESVISETDHLLRRTGLPNGPLLGLLEQGALTLWPLLDEQKAIAALMRRYANLPMSYADACLVRLSELHLDSVALTLDSDFDIYRRNGRQKIPIVRPE